MVQDKPTHPYSELAPFRIDEELAAARGVNPLPAGMTLNHLFDGGFMDVNCTTNRAEKPVTSHATLGGVLSGIEPSLPESLFGEECRAQMRRVADRLPTRLSSFWGFECRLGEPEPLSDILFEIKKEGFGPALLAGESPSALDELCETYPAWGKFRALAKKWIDPSHYWRRDIRNLWLEMDLAGTGADAEKVLRRPNIFFGPERETSNERTLEIIGELAALLERPAFRTPALRKFCDPLPEGAKIFQVGFMLDRPDDTGIRMCVDKTTTEADKILPWFAKLWPEIDTGGIASLGKVLETISPLCRDVNFGFNLTENGAGDAFGVECYEEWLDEDTAQWRPLLDELTRLRLCLPEKARGVEDYAGITASPLRERVDGGTVYLNTYRKIHHLKLTLSRGILTQAKAYLAVSRPSLPLSMFGSLGAVLDSPPSDERTGGEWSAQ
jgi:hypothetical protein